jgi:uncharacterized repeat protein (TIGR01451 family)
VNDASPGLGRLITYTIFISNSGTGDATNAVVSDTLPGGLTFAGPVTLVPPQPGAILAGSAGDLPTLASGLTITVGQRITLTFPVTVNVGLAGGTVLTNTASVTCTEVITPQTGSVAVTIDGLPPVTSNTSVAPGAIQCGSTVTITATVDDSTTGGSIIQAAEYFVDAVGANGTGTPMSAVDGAFDSPVENVIAASVAGLSTGSHTLYVHGRDVAGNWGASDTATVTVRPCLVYLPIIQKAFASAPDLVVERIVVTSNNIQVVIENRGNTPVVDEFWVDVYISPATPPTRVNQTWDMLGSQGLVWGVTASALSQLEPGGTLTLTVGDTYYVADYSTVMWPLPAGTPVYAQVDSAAESSTYGAVLENHEITGGTYNNITSTVSLATGSASLPAGNHGPSGGASPASFGNLPPRQ